MSAATAVDALPSDVHQRNLDPLWVNDHYAAVALGDKIAQFELALITQRHGIARCRSEKANNEHLTSLIDRFQINSKTILATREFVRQDL